jgi:hypothetical protein
LPVSYARELWHAREGGRQDPGSWNLSDHARARGGHHGANRAVSEQAARSGRLGKQKSGRDVFERELDAPRTPEIMGEFVTKIDIISPIRSLENINDSRIAREKRNVMEMWLQKSNSQKINFLAARTIICPLENNHYSKTSEPSKSTGML